MKATLTNATIIQATTGHGGPLVCIEWEDQTEENVTRGEHRVYLPRAVAEAAFQRLFGGVELDVRIERLYRIQKGDTLSQIAERFGCSIHALAARNNIRDHDHIIVGERLCLPKGL